MFKWFTLFFLTLCIACNSNQEGIQHASLHDCEYMLLDSTVQLIDVRTYKEYKYGWIPGAIHMDFYLEGFKNQLSKLDKKKRTIVYCAVGGRSAKACGIMTEMGFKDVYNMQGGIDGWNIHGKKVFVPEEYRKK